MSSDDSHVHAQPDYGTGEKTFNGYFIGIILCVVLTVIPFIAVSHQTLSTHMTVAVIYLSAIAQFLVQVFYFLRLNYTTEQAKMNVLSFIFTIVIMLIVIVGSLWIMWNLDYRMVH